MYKLYQITNTVNKKSYIGITKLSLHERWQIHVSNSNNPKYPLQFAISKYGSDSFSISLLVEHADRHYISELEEPTIQRLQTHISQNGYNVAVGGYGGNLGPLAQLKRINTVNNYSAERKAEHKERLRNRNLGKTKETDPGRLAQSEKIKGNSYRKGILHDSVTRKKISDSNKGKVRSQEAIQNYKKAAKIRGASQFTGKRICCICCSREWDIGNFTQHINRKNI